MITQKEKVIRDNLNIGTFICVEDTSNFCIICGKLIIGYGNNAEPINSGYVAMIAIILG